MAQITHDASVVQQTSDPFVGRWNRLVSTTNWEKGRIICQWRTALEKAGAAAAHCTDEAWSRIVGGVTGQHVGRLRRVFERFGDVYDQYEGLYWSHFQSALDWNDAEMWLEGAIQSRWSVSQMRQRRWETLGAIPDQQPRDGEIVECEVDEDFQAAARDLPPVTNESIEVVQGTRSTSPPSPNGAKDQDAGLPATPERSDRGVGPEGDDRSAVAIVRPFEHLGPLPDDVAEAFESYKLAILRQKATGWREISCEELIASLDALKELALAPMA